jgi:hypothetical protein
MKEFIRACKDGDLPRVQDLANGLDNIVLRIGAERACQYNRLEVMKWILESKFVPPAALLDPLGLLVSALTKDGHSESHGCFSFLLTFLLGNSIESLQCHRKEGYLYLFERICRAGNKRMVLEFICCVPIPNGVSVMDIFWRSCYSFSYDTIKSVWEELEKEHFMIKENAIDCTITTSSLPFEYLELLLDIVENRDDEESLLIITFISNRILNDNQETIWINVILEYYLSSLRVYYNPSHSDRDALAFICSRLLTSATQTKLLNIYVIQDSIPEAQEDDE